MVESRGGVSGISLGIASSLMLRCRQFWHSWPAGVSTRYDLGAPAMEITLPGVGEFCPCTQTGVSVSRGSSGLVRWR